VLKSANEDEASEKAQPIELYLIADEIYSSRIPSCFSIIGTGH
jgi:hypothetical protein